MQPGSDWQARNAYSQIGNACTAYGEEPAERKNSTIRKIIENQQRTNIIYQSVNNTELIIILLIIYYC